MKSAHARLLEELIRERREMLVHHLIGNVHERTAGMIVGLDEALSLSAEADAKLSGEVDVDR